jgi:dTDP-3-amino-3,4,6-trideoxy-alpha-D-glucose transaminase
VARYRIDIDAAIARVLNSGDFILGPRVEEFERAFAHYVGVEHCVGVNSGTDALALSLRALGIRQGDEVITTALTAAATAQAILHCGAIPRFVDVDPLTRCLDPRAVESNINARTAAIVAVHLFGMPAQMHHLQRIATAHSLALVEDCAQAHGASIGGQKVGSFGNAGAFSFYPTKNLGGIGDGGALVTNDASIAAKARALRNYGWIDHRRISSEQGFNSRLDEMQAAVLLALLPYLDLGNRERRAVASRYRALSDIGITLPVDEPGCVYHQFAIAVTDVDRGQLGDYLSTRERIKTAIHYSPPLHQQAAFHDPACCELPQTERLSRQLLSLPIQPETAGRHVTQIIEAIKRGMQHCRES